MIGEGDAVHEKVELAPLLLDDLEDGIDRGRIGDVAMADDLGAEFLRQWAHAFAERLALKGEGQFGALQRGLLGDAPGDRPVVGDAQHQPSLAGEQARLRGGRLQCRFGHPGPAKNDGAPSMNSRV